MSDRSRMPELAYPFAIVGAAAGWLSVTLLDNPLAGYPQTHAGVAAGVCTALVAAAVGATLTRRCAPGEAWEGRSAPWVQLVAAVLAGGAASGAVIGGFAFQTERGISSGAAAGLGCGLAFVPVCALVLAAARRAARARLGSIVAGSDRRAMWAILAAALSVMTLAGVADWLVRETPLVALTLAVSALVATLCLMAWDLRARARVAHAARASEGMETREAPPVEPLPAIDLGLGDEVRASVERGASAYRGRDRATALLVGSPEHARSAIHQALVRGAAGALVAATALVGHALARHPSLQLAYHLRACDNASNVSCGLAADLLESGTAAQRELASVSQPRERACDAYDDPDARSCAILAAREEREPEVSWLRVVKHRHMACNSGDATSCRIYARWLRDGVHVARDTYEAQLLLKRVCQDKARFHDAPARLGACGDI